MENNKPIYMYEKVLVKILCVMNSSENMFKKTDIDM